MFLLELLFIVNLSKKLCLHNSPNKMLEASSYDILVLVFKNLHPFKG